MVGFTGFTVTAGYLKRTVHSSGNEGQGSQGSQRQAIHQKHRGHSSGDRRWWIGIMGFGGGAVYFSGLGIPPQASAVAVSVALPHTSTSKSDRLVQVPGWA